MMRLLLGLFVVVTTICCTVSEVRSLRSRAILLSLGGEEEGAVTSSIASLLLSRGYDVTVFTYGGGGGGGGGEIVQIPIAAEDYLYTTSGLSRYITPSQQDDTLYDVTEPGANQESPLTNDVTPEKQNPNQEPSQTNEVTQDKPGTNQEPPQTHDVTQDNPGANHRPPLSYDVIVTQSRALACKQLLEKTNWDEKLTINAKIFITPLVYHDLCTLTFARQFDLPVVGVVTSRIGSVWAYGWLNVVAKMGIFPLPQDQDLVAQDLLSRLWRTWRYFRYFAKMESEWVDLVTATLTRHSVLPTQQLYDNISHVFVSWDYSTDSQLPLTHLVTPLAGMQWRREDIDKPSILSTQRVQNGAIFCNLKLKELWVGMAAQRAILRALAATPFTVVWRGVAEARQDDQERNNTVNKGRKSAILIYQEHPAIEPLLAHPRHKLMVSMCGESEVTAAILFGSPILCVPVSPDQFLSSSKLHELGLAVVVPARDVTTNKIRDAILQLTTNRNFRSRGRELAEMHLEAPLSPTDQVFYELQKIIRRPLRYKRRGSERLSLLAGLSGDVTAAIFVLMTSLVAVMAALCLRHKKKKKSEKEE